MIVIVGESASGKTSLVNEFVKKHPEYTKVVTYTTRPRRNEEVDGIDYHFIDDDTFIKMQENNEFIEQAGYREWRYGTGSKDLHDNSIAILTPTGLRSLKRKGIPVFSIYLDVDRRSRLIQILMRGDNIDEAYRRNLSDVGQFDGIYAEVDACIENQKYQFMIPELAEKLWRLINEIREN